MSLLCNHVLVCVIHQISDQIDVMELDIIFNIFLNITLNFFFKFIWTVWFPGALRGLQTCFLHARKSIPFFIQP